MGCISVNNAKNTILNHLILRKGSGRISANLLIHYEASPEEVEARLDVLMIISLHLAPSFVGPELIRVKAEICQLRDYLNMMQLLIEAKRLLE
ncbi:hypothetical protein PEDI_12070 [Persicobacter diffluens]|uniref:Uncharacterized protein n=1 Tax=Persicobacter diffluens TaxID=981 RepID=A0AAN5AIN5_9BACT|nr:hypothetical protein PEDI_12070 [Persicobacter diffluens]